jgi:hypothetical protein
LRHSAFESLALDPLLEQRDLILVVRLDGVDHESVLQPLLLLVLLEVALLLQQLVLLKLARQLVHLLAEHHLLGVALVVERLLVRHKLIVEFALANGLNSLFALHTLLHKLVLILFAKLTRF